MSSDSAAIDAPDPQAQAWTRGTPGSHAEPPSAMRRPAEGASGRVVPGEPFPGRGFLEEKRADFRKKYYDFFRIFKGYLRGAYAALESKKNVLDEFYGFFMNKNGITE